MANSNETEGSQWLAVIGRCLAYLCLKSANLGDEKLSDQADFLSRFGLSRADCATILGSTDESLRVLKHREEKGTKRASKKAGSASKKRTS